MDSTIFTLAAEIKSIRLDIAGFQSRVSDLEYRGITVEYHLNTVPERDQELLFLCSKLIDLEDRSHRENSKDFYDPEDLRLYLDDLSTTFMDLTPPTLPSDTTKDSSEALLPLIPSEGLPLGSRETSQRGRDPAKHSRPHDDRGKALLAVEHYTQQTDRAKSCSPL
ncbi:hypothetical protein NDU88_003881 [Pleurodeles waltl]|uniref:Uncharacterized protein n=1 Tax=Pleurodeles waltl TaxID=8319 RepID=A0AAV7WQA8_PLEWA|nr:hypothetical protein NDU88_003881 [Pleurodeles waltl]